MKTYSISDNKILCKSFRPRGIGKLDLTEAVFDKLKTWGTSSITIGFLHWIKNGIAVSPESWRIAWVCWVVNTYIQPYIGLKLIFKRDVSEGINCDVRITFDPELGSYSLIGIDCLDKTSGEVGESTNIGWIDAPEKIKFTYEGVEYTIPSGASNLMGGGGLTGGTILHEFGHILGMIHEHQNPKGVPFNWNRDEVIKVFSGAPNYWDEQTIVENFFLEYERSDRYNGSNFDPKSIMKYSFGDGIKILDKNKYSSIDKYILAVEYLERVNINLSILDKIWLQKTYPGGKAPIIDNIEDEEYDYDSKVSFWKKLDFFIRNIDEKLRKRIIVILLILVIILFIIDFYKFWGVKIKR